MHNNATSEKKSATSLEEIVAHTCFCKLREHCDDKNSPDCLKDRNLYQEFLLSKSPKK